MQYDRKQADATPKYEPEASVCWSNALPAAMLLSENDAVFLSNNKILYTENKQNVTDWKKNFFVFSV